MQLAEKGAAEKVLVKSILEAPSWQAAVEHLGHALVYNASAYKPDQKRKADMGGVPAAVIKGANMALGAPLNFLPAFVLKFQVGPLLLADMLMPRRVQRSADLLAFRSSQHCGTCTWSMTSSSRLAPRKPSPRSAATTCSACAWTGALAILLTRTRISA